MALVKIHPTGIIRRVDDFGRVVVPRTVRNRVGWKEFDMVEFFITDGGDVVLRKIKPDEKNA